MHVRGKDAPEGANPLRNSTDQVPVPNQPAVVVANFIRPTGPRITLPLLYLIPHM